MSILIFPGSRKRRSAVGATVGIGEKTPTGQLENIAFNWWNNFDQESKYEFGIRSTLNADAVWLLRDMEQDERQAERSAKWAARTKVTR